MNKIFPVKIWQEYPAVEVEEILPVDGVETQIGEAVAEDRALILLIIF